MSYNISMVFLVFREILKEIFSPKSLKSFSCCNDTYILQETTHEFVCNEFPRLEPTSSRLRSLSSLHVNSDD